MAQKSKNGYLLIELMIALLLITISGVLMGYLQANIFRWYRCAMSQLKVSVAADRAFKQNIDQDDNITISIESTQPFHHLPFKMMTVCITSKENPVAQIYQFKGGFFDYQSYKKGYYSH